MAKYRILSMDGGGVRGVVTARFLQKIVEQYPTFLDKVNLYAGTSAGAINAVGLDVGLSPKALVDLYKTRSSVIFHDTLWHDLGDLWGLAGAKYTKQGRYDGIHPSIGDVTLGGLPKTNTEGTPRNVLVSTFQLDNANETYACDKPVPAPPPDVPRTWKAKFFHDFPLDNGGTVNTDLDQKAVDVVMRSSAAPTYFPVYEGFVDGGVVANNPSLCALTQAINQNTGKQDIRDIVLLSIGTGGRAKFLKACNNNWGLTQWGLNLVDLLLDTGSGLADYQSRQLLADCYCRLDAALTADIGLDAVDKVPYLIDVVDKMVASGKMDACFDWIATHWLP